MRMHIGQLGNSVQHIRFALSIQTIVKTLQESDSVEEECAVGTSSVTVIAARLAWIGARHGRFRRPVAAHMCEYHFVVWA